MDSDEYARIQYEIERGDSSANTTTLVISRAGDNLCTVVRIWINLTGHRRFPFKESDVSGSFMAEPINHAHFFFCLKFE
jgi:hypothetical protein